MDSRAVKFCKRQADPCACMGGISIPTKSACEPIAYEDISGTLLITGGCGYIGSNTVIMMYERCPNLNIVVVDNLSSTSSSETNVPSAIRVDTSRYTFINASIGDVSAIETIFADHPITMCIALAAWLPYEAKTYTGFAANNVSATHMFIEACAPHCRSVQNPTGLLTHIIFQGSGAARYNSYFNGVTPVTGHFGSVATSTYTSTKAAAINMAMYYAGDVDNPLPITICHPDYVFGGENKPAPEFLRTFKAQLDANERVLLSQADVSNKVAFIGMHDLVDAYAILLLEGFQHKIVQPTNNAQIFTMREVAIMMIAAVKGNGANAEDWLTYTDHPGFIPDYTKWKTRVPTNLGECFVPTKTVREAISDMM